MRKWNAVLSMGILALFLFHAVAGGLQLAGLLPGGSQVMKIGAWVMLALIAMHTVIGIRLTADTLRAIRASGASYFRENQRFWIRRISGFAIMILIVSHLLVFQAKSEAGAVRLHVFAGPQLFTQIMLVVSIAVHVLSNSKPLMIALGGKHFGRFLLDVLVILSALLLASGVAFVIYYLRWNVW